MSTKLNTYPLRHLITQGLLRRINVFVSKVGKVINFHLSKMINLIINYKLNTVNLYVFKTCWESGENV